MDLEVASEFVTMASHLVYIKTRMLLSIEDEEAQSEMDALIQSLEERRAMKTMTKIKAMAQRLAPMGEFGRNILTRTAEPVERGKDLSSTRPGAGGPDSGHGGDPQPGRTGPAAAQDRFQDIVRHEPYPVESKAREIHPAAQAHGITSFLHALPGQPQPQRGGGHLPGGSGAVPGLHHPSGGL